MLLYLKSVPPLPSSPASFSPPPSSPSSSYSSSPPLSPFPTVRVPTPAFYLLIPRSATQPVRYTFGADLHSILISSFPTLHLIRKGFLDANKQDHRTNFMSYTKKEVRPNFELNGNGFHNNQDSLRTLIQRFEGNVRLTSSPLTITSLAFAWADAVCSR